MRCLALLLALVVSVAAHAAPAASDPQGALTRAKLAYERGEYAAAVELLGPLLYPQVKLTTEEAVLDAHKVLALSYLFQKKPGDAETEVTALLALRPQFELDPIVDPPQAVAFFNDIRQKQAARLDELRRRQAAEEEEKRRREIIRLAEERAKAQRIYVDRTVQIRSRTVAALPFGIGQFQNGNKKLGAFFLTSELVTGIVSASTFIAIEQIFGPGRKEKDLGLSKSLTGAQIGFGVGFWLLAISGVIEAQVRFVPRAALDGKERERPKLKSRLFLAPVVGPGTVGASSLLIF